MAIASEWLKFVFGSVLPDCIFEIPKMFCFTWTKIKYDQTENTNKVGF